MFLNAMHLYCSMCVASIFILQSLHVIRVGLWWCITTDETITLACLLEVLFGMCSSVFHSLFYCFKSYIGGSYTSKVCSQKKQISRTRIHSIFIVTPKCSSLWPLLRSGVFVSLPAFSVSYSCHCHQPAQGFHNPTSQTERLTNPQDLFHMYF